MMGAAEGHSKEWVLVVREGTTSTLSAVHRIEFFKNSKKIILLTRLGAMITSMELYIAY